MNASIAFLSRTLAAIAVLAAACAPAAFANEDDHTIRPGTGVGDLRLGMTRPAVRKLLEHIDGSYKLPNGQNVDYAVWHDKGDQFIRMVYDNKNKLVQINSEMPIPATANGVSLKSTLADVKAKFPGAKALPSLPVKGDQLRYLDDSKKGIAFTLTNASDKLSQIIVHRPGVAVLRDVERQPTSK